MPIVASLLEGEVTVHEDRAKLVEAHGIPQPTTPGARGGISDIAFIPAAGEVGVTVSQHVVELRSPMVQLSAT
jgi:hypothetical protein